MNRLALVFALAFVATFAVSARVPTLPDDPPIVTATAIGCSPGLARRAPEAIRQGCVLIRALTDDGTIHDVCAEAEDLAPLFAPLVDLLIAEHKEARERGAQVAFALPVSTVKPTRAPPKRKCVKWLSLVDAGADAGGDDAGADGGP